MKGKRKPSAILNAVKKLTNQAALMFMLVCVLYTSSSFVGQRAQSVMATKTGYLAIVIDDFGYGGEGTEEIMALDIPLTCAVLPFSEGTQDIILQLENTNKEAILHMPMESLHGKKSWVGDKGIFLDMDTDEVKAVLGEAFSNVTAVVGLNNHMGSAIMEDEEYLKMVIEELKDRDMFFLDSVTTPNSKASEICQEYGVCFLKRDVFLDGTTDINIVKNNLKKAADIALENGFAIAIGHVGPEGGVVTAQAIEQMKEDLERMGVKFVTLSQLKEIKEGINPLSN